jgi:hypothetical protein
MEVVMSMQQVTVKDLLEERFGNEKTIEVLDEVKLACEDGENDYQTIFQDAIRKKAPAQVDTKLVFSHVLPTP